MPEPFFRRHPVRSSGAIVSIFFSLLLASAYAGSAEVTEILGSLQNLIMRNPQALSLMQQEAYGDATALYLEMASSSHEIGLRISRLPAEEQALLSISTKTAADLELSSALNAVYCLRQQERLAEAESLLNRIEPLIDAGKDPDKAYNLSKERAYIKLDRQQFYAATIVFEGLRRSLLSRLNLPMNEGKSGNVASTTFAVNDAVTQMEDELFRLRQSSQVVEFFTLSLTLAGIYSRLGDHERAWEIVNHPAARALVRQCRRLCLPSASETVATELLSVLDKYFAGFLSSYFHLTRASVLQQLERHQESVVEFASAGAFLKATEGQDLGMVALLNNRSLLFAAMGNLDASINDLREAEALLPRLSPAFRKKWQATILVNMVAGLIDQHRYSEAEKLCVQAEELAKELGDANLLWGALSHRGRIHAALGRRDEARACFDQAIQTLEKFRLLLGTERFRRSFMAGRGQVYSYMVKLLLDMGKDREAFQYAERARARAFVDLLDQIDSSKLIKRKQAELLREERERLEREKQKIQRDRQALQRAAEGFPQSPGDQKRLSQLMGFLDPQKLQSLIEAERRFAELAGPEFAAMTDVGDPPKLEDIASLIGTDAALLAYFIEVPPNAETIGRASCFVLSRSADSETASVTAITLPASSASILQTSRQITSLLQESGTDQRVQDGLRRLHDDLVAPVLPAIQGKTRLIIIPQSVLYFVPFGALCNEKDEPLINFFSITYLPNVATLKFCRAKNHRRFDSCFGYAFGNQSPNSLAALPGSLKETEYLQQRFPAPAGRFYREAQLSPGDFIRQVEQADIVHLATHGLLSTVVPLESSVAIGTGTVPVSDVMSLDLQATLVVLSACQTGLGNLYKGDEVVGLTRAFIYAGSPSVLSSLWPVSDQATALLMTSFYDRLLAGDDKAESLRQAQLLTRKSFPDPRDWAGFFLTGDWQ